MPLSPEMVNARINLRVARATCDRSTDRRGVRSDDHPAAAPPSCRYIARSPPPASGFPCRRRSRDATGSAVVMPCPASRSTITCTTPRGGGSWRGRSCSGSPCACSALRVVALRRQSWPITLCRTMATSTRSGARRCKAFVPAATAGTSGTRRNTAIGSTSARMVGRSTSGIRPTSRGASGRR